MKKILVLLLCLIFIFSGCSGESDSAKSTTLKDSVVENYIGEGTMTALRFLVNSNAFLVESVFIKNHLPVDLENTVENDSGTFAPVVSDKIKTYADLESTVNSTYTKEIAEKLLSEKRYVEIDGKLYFDMKFDTASSYDKDWTDYEIDVSNAADGEYSIDINVKNIKGRKTVITASAVTVDGSLRLNDIYS